ncbi:MAG: hypothetical protein WBQ68_14285 [Terriglobales bacterium]
MTDPKNDLDAALADDQDRGKGAVEQDRPEEPSGNTSMQGQLGHRDQNPLLKSADTDFPEPGENPEHSQEPTQGTAASKKKDVA